MAIKPLLQQMRVWILASVINAYSVQLPSAVSRLIPDCAQDCLVSFIETNYPSTRCGTAPSLQCLCSHQTESNFTIGEGAVECIVASEDLGTCSSNVVNSTSISEAYDMCSGQMSALPNTHSTLSATVEVAPSGVAIIIIATPTSEMSLTTFLGTTTPTRSTTSSKSHTTASPILTTASSSSTTTGASATTTSAATAEPVSTSSSSPAASSSAPNIGRGQVAGIAVGVVGAVGLALGAIFYARHVRRRRYPEYDGDSTFGFDEKRRRSFGYRSEGEAGGLASRLTRIFHISPPIHRCESRGDTPSPPPQIGEVIDRSTIGLAISRPPSNAPPRRDPAQWPIPNPRPTSKSLPPEPLQPPPRIVKPDLTLDIPRRSSKRLRSSQFPQTDRTQTDRTSSMTNMTAFADLDVEADGNQIWRPPPSDPASATAYYIADRFGNWSLVNENRQSELGRVPEAVELDSQTPLTKSPIEKKEEAEVTDMANAISAADAVPNIEKPRPAFYFLGQDPAGPRTDAEFPRTSSIYSQASAPRPTGRTLVPAPPAARRRSGSGPRRGPNRSNSQDSYDSTTTINSSSSSPFEDDAAIEPEPAHLSTLSPVVESPISPGRSPVTYPKIPGRLNQAILRRVPPPKFPVLTTSPPGQPSPTLGLEGSPSAYPAPLNPQRQSGRRTPPPQTSGSGFSPMRSEIPRFPIPPQGTTYPPRSDSLRQPQGPPRIDTRQPVRPHISSFISPISAETRSSGASSLLAKRIGSERAAALALEQNQDPRRREKWRRQDGAGRLFSPEAAALRSPRTQLPATPTWKPKLTPTRRGDDLFLNVQ